MKFLIALSILASSSVFAQGMDERFIKCYEAPQQTERQDVAYAFKAYEGYLKLVYPRELAGPVRLNEEYCLERENVAEADMSADSRWFEACRGEGQSINHLVPVEIEEREFEGTVYCEKSILRWFRPVNGTPVAF